MTRRILRRADAHTLGTASTGGPGTLGPGGSSDEGQPEPRVIRCQAERKQPRFPGERCNGFVHRTTRDVRVHGLVQHSREARADMDVVGCIRCGALHVVTPGGDARSGARVLEPP